jgi:DNA-binding protein Fis
MEVFKSHIYEKSPSPEIESERQIQGNNTLVFFSERLPTLKQVEQSLIDEALKRAKGNQSIAARTLGISRQALNKRVKKSQH